MPVTALPRLGEKRKNDAVFGRHCRQSALVVTAFVLAACQAPTNQQIGGVTGSAVGAISSQTPSAVSISRAAAAMAEARLSRPAASAGAGSATATESCGAPRFSASASDRPT